MRDYERRGDAAIRALAPGAQVAGMGALLAQGRAFHRTWGRAGVSGGLLPGASLVITHGEMGTVMAGLAHGVPLELAGWRRQVTVSPQTPDQSLTFAEQKALEFPVLSDAATRSPAGTASGSRRARPRRLPRANSALGLASLVTIAAGHTRARLASVPRTRSPTGSRAPLPSALPCAPRAPSCRSSCCAAARSTATHDPSRAAYRRILTMLSRRR